MKTVKAIRSKGLLIAILAIVMMFALAACGSGNNAQAPVAAPPVETAPVAAVEVTAPVAATETTVEETTDEVVEEDEAEVEADVYAYVLAMNEFIWAFEELTEFLFYLVELLDYIETDEELLDWIYAFEAIKGATEEAMIGLTETAELAPAEYQEAHIKIAAAVTLVYEAMIDLDYALLDAIMGYYDDFYAGIENFVIHILAADYLWEQAVGASAHDPEILGIWGMAELADWQYDFRADGTGIRGIGDDVEMFFWETRDNELWIDRGEATPANEIRLERWAYTIVDGTITFVSRQEAGMVFIFNRQ
jgi:predicted small lipoprotein YifL